LWIAREQTYEALIRALTEKSIPKTIRTSDLKSPFDGKPISYRFDGRQIVISVSTGSTDVVDLRLPRDDELKPAVKRGK
jgi:hypothetical protein